MSNEFNFSYLVKFMAEQWNLLKDDLYNGEVNYDDKEKLIKDYTFFKVFDDMFNQSAKFFKVSLKSINPMFRGVGEKVSLDYYKRMVPDLEHSDKHNRLNPPCKVFLYLGILGEDKGRDSKTVKKHIVRTCLKELRASKDTIATFCNFQVSGSGESKIVIDVTGDSQIPTHSELELNNYIKKQIQKFKGRMTDKEVISSVLSNHYFNMFSSDHIFKPIETASQDVKKKEYAPFQALAHYISEQGYGGMIYKSTVHRNGTNLVLFNTDYAFVVPNSMEHIKASEFL